MSDFKDYLEAKQSLANDPDGDDDANGMKPIFDGRMQFFKIVYKYMEAISEAVASDNYYGWLKNLQGLNMLLAPYMKEDYAKEVEDGISAAKAAMLNVNKAMPLTIQFYAGGQVGDKLYKTTKLLHKYSAHVLLPGNDSDSGDFDPKKGTGR